MEGLRKSSPYCSEAAEAVERPKKSPSYSRAFRRKKNPAHRITTPQISPAALAISFCHPGFFSFWRRKERKNRGRLHRIQP